MVAKLHVYQLARVSEGKPLYTDPSFPQVPYVGPEIYELDPVIADSGVAAGYPTPTLSDISLSVGGTVRGNSYTTAIGDAGKSVVNMQSAAFGTKVANASSPAVTIEPYTTWGSYGLLGGNIDNTHDYNTVRLLNNAANEGRGWGIQGANSGTYSLATFSPAGSLSLSTLTAGTGVTVTLTGTGTTALAGTSTSDIGKTIHFISGSGNSLGTATVTGITDTTHCTVTLNNTLTTTSWAAGLWTISGPSLIFSATSGSGVTMQVDTTASTILLTGDARDVNKAFTISGVAGNGGVTATVTAFGTTTQCTVTITNGPLSALIVPASAIDSALGSTIANWTVTPAKNSDGYPLTASQNIITSSPGGTNGVYDGQLAAGTYHWTVKSTDPTILPVSSGSAGVTMTTPTTPTLIGGVYVTTFSTTHSTGSVFSLYLNKGITFIDCPRDGSASSVGQPLFTSACLAFNSQFPMIRFMDWFNMNLNTETDWSQRQPDYAVCHNKYSYEFWVLFANALFSYSGSVFKEAHLCYPGNPPSSYASSLSALLNTLGLNSGIGVYPERHNEEWNFAFRVFSADRLAAITETLAVSTTGYASPTPLVTSVTGDGTNVTINFAAGTMPSWITTSATFIAFDATTAAWSKGAYGAPISVASTTSASFTYVHSVGGTGPTGTQPAGDLAVYYFNPSSTLLANGDFSLFNQTYKYHVRSHYNNWVAWSVNRPQDRFLLSMQMYGGATAFASNTPVQLSYAAFLGGGSATWAYGAVVAYYNQPGGFTPSATLTLGAVSGAGISCTLSTVTPNALSGTSSDVGRIISMPGASGTATATIITAIDGTHCTVTMNSTAASTTISSGTWSITPSLDALFLQFIQRQAALFTAMQFHVFTCKRLGLRPMAYEGGPDFTHITDVPTQYAATRDTRMQGIVDTLVSTWWLAGGCEFCYYQVSPAPGAYWSALESYADTASPKLLGLLQAAATTKSNVEISVSGAADLSNFWYFHNTAGNTTSNATTGIIYSFSNAAIGSYGFLISVNRTRRYRITLWSTCTVAGQVATILVDGTAVGTSTMALGLAPSSNSAVAAPSVDTFVVEIASGGHALIVNTPVIAGAAGILKVTLTPA